MKCLHKKGFDETRNHKLRGLSKSEHCSKERCQGSDGNCFVETDWRPPTFRSAFHSNPLNPFFRLEHLYIGWLFCWQWAVAGYNWHRFVPGRAACRALTLALSRSRFFVPRPLSSAVRSPICSSPAPGRGGRCVTGRHSRLVPAWEAHFVLHSSRRRYLCISRQTALFGVCINLSTVLCGQDPAAVRSVENCLGIVLFDHRSSEFEHSLYIQVRTLVKNSTRTTTRFY